MWFLVCDSETVHFEEKFQKGSSLRGYNSTLMVDSLKFYRILFVRNLMRNNFCFEHFSLKCLVFELRAKNHVLPTWCIQNVSKRYFSVLLFLSWNKSLDMVICTDEEQGAILCTIPPSTSYLKYIGGKIEWWMTMNEGFLSSIVVCSPGTLTSLLIVPCNKML